MFHEKKVNVDSIYHMISGGSRGGGGGASTMIFLYPSLYQNA